MEKLGDSPALFIVAIVAGLLAARWLVHYGDRTQRRLRRVLQPKSAPSWHPRGEQKLPYTKRLYLLTRAERAFFDVLRAVVADELLVFTKVRMLDVLWLPENVSNREIHVNRVVAKHLDFVLCDRRDVAPVLAIELDDATRASPDSAERGAFVDEVLRTAGLPLLRLPVRPAYDPEELADAIRAALRRRPVRDQPALVPATALSAVATSRSA